MSDLSAEARELAVYAENERGIYFGYIVPTLDNLAKHYARGQYSVDLAISSWLRVANGVAKNYQAEYGSMADAKWFRAFPLKVRTELAEHFEAYYRDEVYHRSGSK